MIPYTALVAWGNFSPWESPDQVEHDLVLSRAIAELYSHPLIAKTLVFRGGTALHKLFFEKAGRFSEDLDFVQVNAKPIGKTVNAIREALDHWLGAPSWKQNQGRFTLNYHFTTETEPVITRKVKIEINTREHFKVQPYALKHFEVKNQWYSGTSSVLTYTIEELLATKLRALHQRRKGRDLYDFWYVTQQLGTLQIDTIIDIFEHYMEKEGNAVSRAEFEQNLSNKRNDILFNNDIMPLLTLEQANQYHIEHAFDIIDSFVARLKGAAWKGKGGLNTKKSTFQPAPSQDHL